MSLPLQDTEFNFTRVKYSGCQSAKHKPSNFIHSHLIHARVVASYPLIGCCCTIPSIRRPSPQRLDINHHMTSNAQYHTHAACHDFMYNKLKTLRNHKYNYPLLPLLNYSSTISAVQSLRISNSDRSAVFSITRPFSLAKCSRQMKQYDVEMSSITGLGYTDCRLFMTEVNLRGSS